MGECLYVYYRVRAIDEALVREAVHGMHARWAPDLQCALFRRTGEDSPDSLTLMETYSADGGVSDAWRSRIEAEASVALLPWLIGQRHVERFERCA
jgi:hypothetical protein